VIACVNNGVNVIQGDMERGLEAFADDSFDYVILSQTLQAVKSSERVVREMLRVGRQGIVTFPNFGYWRNRLQVVAGNMPVSANLPYTWFDTPNIHLCTVNDFENFCRDHGVRILERTVITGGRAVNLMPNLLGSLAVFRFERA
jgi:methionine biosynthesis protein MetW